MAPFRPAPRLLIVRAGALGDSVLTLPAVCALRSWYPGASIRVAGYPDIWDVARPLIDDVASIDSPLFAGLFSGSPSPELKTWLQDVDLAIAWTARDAGPALRAAGVPTVISASPYPPPGVHAAEWLLRTLEHLTSCPPSLPSRAPLVGAREGSEGAILLHPGAGAIWKRWPAERFSRLADELARSGQTVLLVEGPADAEVVAEVQERSEAHLQVLRDLPVRRLASILADGKLIVGNDSGVTHLAAAAGVPTIALFGPTDPVSWAPLGDVHVLRSCSSQTGYQGQVRVCDDPDCMKGISVDDVLAAVDSL